MIKRLHIQNFKSLRDVEVLFEPLTVLIGRSGSGKTNIIDAMRFLRGLATSREPQKVFHDHGGVDKVFYAAGTKEDVLSIEVEFDVPGQRGDFVYKVSVRRGRNGPVVAEEGLWAGGKVIYRQSCPDLKPSSLTPLAMQWIDPPPISPVPTAGAMVIGTIFGVREAKLAHLALSEGMGCYDFPGTVLSAHRANDASQTRHQGTALMDDASNYLSVFDAIQGNLAAIETSQSMLAALQRLNPSVSNIELTPQKDQIKVGHQAGEGHYLAFDLQQESEGFRRFLAQLLAIHQQPPRQVLAFEEPEKGIFPGALAVLADFYRAAASHGQSQIILTTHSPQLLGHFEATQIRVVELSGYETRVGPLAPEQRDALNEQLMSADELLTVDPARMAAVQG